MEKLKARLDALSEAATASSREMAEELGNRFGVRRLIEIWERHNDDIRSWKGALDEFRQSELEQAVREAVAAERETCAATCERLDILCSKSVAAHIRARTEGESQ